MPIMEPPVMIKDLRPGMKNLNMIFIILEALGPPSRTKTGEEVRTFKVADKTGSVNLSVWNELGQMLQPGDICRLQRGYTQMFKTWMTLYQGKSGELHKIGEFCMQFSENPNLSEPNPEFIAQFQQKLQHPDQHRGSPTLSGPPHHMGSGGPPPHPAQAPLPPTGLARGFRPVRD